jgi:F-type H+-transporting ATPase subunit gamma
VADRIGQGLLGISHALDHSSVEIVYPRRAENGAVVVERSRVLPVDPPAERRRDGFAPLTMLPIPFLVAQVAVEYVHARLFELVAHSFVAANAASLAVLQAAHAHLDEMVADLRRAENVLRQEEITAEVLEVITGRIQEVS